jgi:hypothetical protein
MALGEVVLALTDLESSLVLNMTFRDFDDLTL